MNADGIYGPRTDAALSNSASPALALLKRELGLSVAPAVQAGGNWTFIPQSELDAGVAAAVAEFGSPVEEFLRLLIRMENRPAPGGVLTKFDQTYKGVAQFGAPTWELGTAAGKYPKAGSYENVRDTTTSLKLAAWFFLDNGRIYDAYRRRRGMAARYDARLGYLFHQQGSPAAITFLDSGKLEYPAQSAESIALFRAMRSEVVV